MEEHLHWLEDVLAGIPAQSRRAILGGVRWAIEHPGVKPPSMRQLCTDYGNMDCAKAFTAAARAMQRSIEQPAETA